MFNDLDKFEFEEAKLCVQDSFIMVMIRLLVSILI